MTYSGQVLMLINFGVCSGIVLACICRLNTPSCKYDKYKRAKYTLMLTASMASAFQKALFNETPTTAGVIIAIAVLVGLIIHMPRWARKDQLYEALK